MAVFISYSSHDVSRVEQLAATLRRAREEIWYDSELGGGDAWWRMILERIRQCDVFLVALSQNMAQSKACQGEVQYAQALGKPIVPVQVGPVDSMRTNPLAATQVIDFQNPTIDTGIELVAALNAARQRTAPLSDPLPEEPPMPFAYLMRLGGLISSPTLTSQQQTVVVAELRAGFDDDGEDPSARKDLMSLLQKLRDRSDVTYRTRTEVDELLAAVTPRPAAVPAWSPPPLPPPPSSPSFPMPSAPPPRNSNKGVLIGAGVACAVVVAVVAVIVATTGGDSTPAGSEATSSTADAPSGTPKTAVSGSPRSMLLTPEEVESVMGVETLDPQKIVARMDDNPPDASRIECLGASYGTLEAAYKDSGYTDMASQSLAADGYDYMWVSQGVVTFGSEAQAKSFLDESATRWSACSGDTVTMKFGSGAVQDWTYGDVTTSDSQVTQKNEQVGTAGYGCQHVLRRNGKVVIDVLGCRTPPGDEGLQIVNKIAEKVDAA